MQREDLLKEIERLKEQIKWLEECMNKPQLEVIGKCGPDNIEMSHDGYLFIGGERLFIDSNYDLEVKELF